MKRRSFLRLSAARDRATAVEFALVAAPFLILNLGAIAFGRLIWTREALQATATQAARCMGMLARSCASAGAYSQAKSISYIQTVANG